MSLISTLPWIIGGNKGYMSGTTHGKVIRSNGNFVTGRVMAELICAHESEILKLVITGGVDARVSPCMHVVPGNPW